MHYNTVWVIYVLFGLPLILVLAHFYRGVVPLVGPQIASVNAINALVK